MPNDYSWVSNIDYSPEYGYRVVIIDRKNDQVHIGESLDLEEALSKALKYYGV